VSWQWHAASRSSRSGFLMPVIFLVAGGVTYAVLLALFPGLAALVSIYGLLLDRSQVEQQVAALSNVLPRETAEMIGEELHKLVTAPSGSLSISAGVALLLAIWSASRGPSSACCPPHCSLSAWKEFHEVAASSARIAAADRGCHDWPCDAVPLCAGPPPAPLAVGISWCHRGEAAVETELTNPIFTEMPAVKPNGMAPCPVAVHVLRPSQAFVVAAPPSRRKSKAGPSATQ
jgi:hypothetical protein